MRSTQTAGPGFWIAGLLIIGAALPAAARRQTSDPIGTEGVFRFVGVSDPDVAPGSWLSAADLRLLATLQQPATPNEILQRGIPFQASQLTRLQRDGFLVQEGTRFRSTLPVLGAERAARVRQIAHESSVQIVASLRSELSELSSALSSTGYSSAFPAIVNWLLRERVWGRILEGDLLHLRALIDTQRASSPNRGWWGVLWYLPTASDPQTYVSVSSKDRAVHACWTAGRVETVRGLAPGGDANRFLDSLRDGGRRVKNPGNFPQLLATDVIDPDGSVLVPAWEWTPQDPSSVPGLVERLTQAMVVAIVRDLPVAALAAELGSQYGAEAATVGYVEIVPPLLRAIIAAGHPMALAEQPSFDPRPGGSSGIAIPIRERSMLPEISVVIWRKIREPRPAIPIAW